MKKCEKMKIIFTFGSPSDSSCKIFKIFTRVLAYAKKSKKSRKCVDNRVFLC